MVMDMFYSCVETENKKRVHFHGFMLDVHKSEFLLQSALGSGSKLCQFCFSVPLTATRGQISKPLRWHIRRRDVDAFEIMKLCFQMQTVSNVSPSSLSADLQSLVNIMSSTVCDNSSRPLRHQQLFARYLHASTLRHYLNTGTVLQFSLSFRCILNISHVTRRKHISILSLYIS